MNTLFRVSAAVVFIAMTFAGIYATADGKPTQEKSVYAVLDEVPAKDHMKTNPFENDPQAVASGRKLYELHCSECHGDKAQGTRYAPSLVHDEVQNSAPGTLFWILTNGIVRHGMPVWSKLPPQQRWQLVTFLKSLKLTPPASTAESAPPIEPKNR